MLPRGQASRESEICSFLRHSVRPVAESADGSARFCNARCGLLVHKSGAAWQRRTGGRRVTQPCLHCHRGRPQDCPRAPGVLPVWGYGFRGAGSVPRVSEDSTYVRKFQEGWRNCGIGADWWGEMVQTWGLRGSCVGLDGSGPGNGWRGRVTFFRVLGSEWVAEMRDGVWHPTRWSLGGRSNHRWRRLPSIPKCGWWPELALCRPGTGRGSLGRTECTHPEGALCTRRAARHVRTRRWRKGADRLLDGTP